MFKKILVFGLMLCLLCLTACNDVAPSSENLSVSEEQSTVESGASEEQKTESERTEQEDKDDDEEKEEEEDKATSSKKSSSKKISSKDVNSDNDETFSKEESSVKESSSKKQTSSKKSSSKKQTSSKKTSSISNDDDFWDPEITSKVESAVISSELSSSSESSNLKEDDEEDIGYEMNETKKKYSKYIDYRSALPYTYKKLTEKKELNIIYYGGSVTVGGSNAKSWRKLVGQWFEENFPDAKINNMSRAIGATGSRFGLYRLSRDVLPYKPDLIFIEFAINDYYHPEDSTSAAMMMETMIREIKTAYPECEIVTLLTTEKVHGSISYNNMLYSQAQSHDEVSEYYNIPTVRIGCAAVNRMGENYRERWNLFFEDVVHPNVNGHKYYYDCIEEFLINSLKNTEYKASAYGKKELPNIKGFELFDGNRTYVEITPEILAQSEKLGGHGFKIAEDKVYSNSVPHGYIKSYEENAVFVFEFVGTDFEIAGGTKTEVEITVDGVKAELKDDTMRNVSIPQCVVNGLESGKHKVEIKIPKSYSAINAIMYRDASKATSFY